MASKGRVVDTCFCHVCEGIRWRLNRIFFLLREFGWLLDTYIVDFFEDEVWKRLPSSWRKTLGDASPEELGNWAIGEKNGTRIWPLSLLAFQKVIKYLEINRDYENREIIECSRDRKSRRKRSVTDPAKRKQLDEEYQKLFTRSVKEKKRHEIDNIAEVTSECANFSSCECIVDIGAGMGHLARTLAFNYGLHVICLEQNEFLSNQAKICDEKLLVQLRKKKPGVALKSPPHHVSTRIVESDAESKELVKNMKNEFSRYFKLNQDESEFGLVGLHTCGDLAANLIRLYSEHDETRFICIVGCCYMKITCGARENNKFGYPLSKYVSMASDHEFSYAALEVACHAIESYCDKLRTGDYHDLLVHAYRATLETVLVRRNGPSMRRSHLKNVKLKKDASFERYCEDAVGNLKPEHRPGIDDFKTDRVKDCLARWREVVAFGTLRFMLAPLVETAVLFDRFLYLSERDSIPSLQPVFDPRISPRNIVLISSK